MARSFLISIILLFGIELVKPTDFVGLYGTQVSEPSPQNFLCMYVFVYSRARYDNHINIRTNHTWKIFHIKVRKKQVSLVVGFSIVLCIGFSRSDFKVVLLSIDYPRYIFLHILLHILISLFVQC